MHSQVKSLRFIVLLAILGTFLIINASVVFQADAQVLLTEVDYHNGQIEIVNTRASVVNISHWQLCSRIRYLAISVLTVPQEGTKSLQPGGIVALSELPWDNASVDLGLYNSRSFRSSAAM